MYFKPKIFLLVFPFAFLSATAHASDSFCNNYVAGSPLPQFQCVQTTVGPGAPMIVSPDQAGAGPRFASSVSAGSGLFASASSANASASPGLLRGKAFAEMLGGSIEGAQAVARSDAWFSDVGTVLGVTGVPVGTPVTLRFTIDLAGSFAGGGIFTALSEAAVDLVARGSNGAFLHTGGVINKFNPLGFVTSDVDALVGDSFQILMKLHVSAGAINNSNPANTMSVADVTNTSYLFVDVLSANADFIGSGGHLYATTAPVPEPAEYAMLLVGLVLTGALARRRAPHSGSARYGSRSGLTAISDTA